jgi:hypothetical protein
MKAILSKRSSLLQRIEVDIDISKKLNNSAQKWHIDIRIDSLDSQWAIHRMALLK